MSRSKFQTSAELTALTIMRQLALPGRRIDLVDMFCKRPSHLSKIFMEGMYRFCHASKHILSDQVHAGFVADKAMKHADASSRNIPVLVHCIRFLDGMVLEIAISCCLAEQKRPTRAKLKKSIKFQNNHLQRWSHTSCRRTNREMQE